MTPQGFSQLKESITAVLTEGLANTFFFYEKKKKKRFNGLF